MQLREINSLPPRNGWSPWCNGFAPDGMVAEPQFRHRRRIKQIASIENNRGGHFSFHYRQINVGKILPFRRNDEGFSVLDGFERALAKAGRLDFGDLAG